MAIMYLGRIAEDGATAAIFRQPAHPYTAALMASQPHPDPARRRTSPILRGEVTSLRDRPSGCEFHPRCPRQGEPCRSIVPERRETGEGQGARCHFPLG
jgi:oligopeptide/dipeptide ABC transporter ATP-binding protein